MSCCGHKRATQKTASALARARRSPSTFMPPAETPQAGKTDNAVLHYLGVGSISLCGPHTGRVYYFSAVGNGTVVDDNDLDALLRTQLFAFAGRQPN